MDKLLFKRILITLISVIAIIYTTYLLLTLNNDFCPTENAVKVTVYNSIYADAFIIRDESIVTNNSSGVLSYSLNDGESVFANGEIAKVYGTVEDAAAQTKIDQLEEKINTLKTLQKNAVANTVGIDTINTSIKNNMMQFLTNINKGNIQSVNDDVHSLISSINQRQIFTGKINNFDAEIANLQSQVDALKASSSEATGTIKTEYSGSFFSYCDGYENSVAYKDVEKLKLADLDKIKKGSIPTNAAGKVIKSLKWYIACKVPANKVIDISLWEGPASVLLSNASNDKVPVNIERISQEDKDSDALVILSCNYMNPEFIEARNEPVNIILGKYTGLRISKKAIHDDYVEKITYDENDNKIIDKKKVQGVYVLYGNEVKFKQVSILYSDKDYVICDESPSYDLLFNGETISLYDKIIVDGNDLYDGKIVK